MMGIEIDRLVAASAKDCPDCRAHRGMIGFAHGDLNAAAKKATRWETATLVNAVTTAKTALQGKRDDALRHFDEAHSGSEASA